MLGETDLLRGPLEPGGRMPSMMAPSLALDDRGLVLAIGAAGGTRLRTALLTVAAAILDEGVEPQEAVDRPRVHPAGTLVNAEPGVDEDGAGAARGVRPHRPPLAGAAPLLRRRQRDRANGPRGGSAPERCGARGSPAR